MKTNKKYLNFVYCFKMLELTFTLTEFDTGCYNLMFHGFLDEKQIMLFFFEETFDKYNKHKWQTFCDDLNEESIPLFNAEFISNQTNGVTSIVVKGEHTKFTLGKSGCGRGGEAEITFPTEICVPVFKKILLKLNNYCI